MTKFFILFLFLFVRCKELYALEIKTDCSDLPQIQKLWEEKYYHDFKFGTKKDKPTQLVCESEHYKAAKVLWLLDHAKSADRFNYYKKIKKLTSPYDVGKKCGEISTLSCPSFDFPFSQDPEYNYKFNLIFRLAHLIHEARHFELKEKGNHVQCKDRPDDGSCDRKFVGDRRYAKTYSYEIIYFKNIIFSNDFDEVTIAAIKQYSELILTEKINEL